MERFFADLNIDRPSEDMHHRLQKFVSTSKREESKWMVLQHRFSFGLALLELLATSNASESLQQHTPTADMFRGLAVHNILQEWAALNPLLVGPRKGLVQVEGS